MSARQKFYVHHGMDIYGLISVDDVSCQFEIEAEKSWREPYSWGESRGFDVEITATLDNLRLGEFKATRNQAVLIFGEAAIIAAEEFVANGVSEGTIE